MNATGVRDTATAKMLISDMRQAVSQRSISGSYGQLPTCRRLQLSPWRTYNVVATFEDVVRPTDMTDTVGMPLCDYYW